ncbi:hypothetical protein CMZ84_15075 [Lysobacteraceae bacterium NML93-0399]|nr:hypothetical protein CMZ84_15075 [Xanthomonadaceae bacterium NML93-0399]
MHAQDVLALIGSQLLGTVPVLIALVVALLLVATRREVPRASRIFGLCGFGVFLLAILLSVVGFPLLQVSARSAGMDLETLGLAMAVLSGVLGLLHATALILLAVAIVRRR